MYISDKIGEEYLKWNKGQLIFISSPTGSGKTTFILKHLLPHIAQMGEKCLYLVNRKILRSQIIEEVGKLPVNQQVAIQVVTYQHIENLVENSFQNNNLLLLNKFKTYRYVVCDEAHYFLSDANFNTKNCLSYGFIWECLPASVCIFISATIDEVRARIKEDFSGRNHTNYLWIADNYLAVRNFATGMTSTYFPTGNNIKCYESDTDYSYITVKLVLNVDKFCEKVAKGNDKWLIFVASIDEGNKLRRKIMSLIDKGEKRAAVFINAGYEEEDEADENVRHIVSKNKPSAQIVIATSVMDNGISIKDEKMKKIAIFADNKTEFIQMLGRRRGRENLELYIYQRNKNHFISRRRSCKKKMEIITEYNRNIADKIKSVIDSERPVITEMNNLESEVINYFTIKLMKDYSERKIGETELRELFRYSGLYLLPNHLSFQNQENLNAFYNDMIDRFEEEGEDAFFYEQLSWIGMGRHEAVKIIEEEKTPEEAKCKKRVMEELDDTDGKELSKDESIALKKRLKSDLSFLLNNCKVAEDIEAEKTRYINNIRRNDRAISDGMMEFLSKYCDIPFTCKCSSEKYIYRRKER